MWSNLLFKQADQHVSPRAFEILGVGIHKHKTNSTGKLEWTGITRHAKADQDAFAALADLLAHEIAELQTDKHVGLSRPTRWCRISFPKGDKTEQQRVQQLTALLNKVTKRVKGQG